MPHRVPEDSRPRPDLPISAVVRRAPKVLLHDHLDGGLRPETILAVADEIGHELPAQDPARLAAWFVEACDSGSLPRYLETFDHTVAVMQREQDLRRVARECAEDLAADGVVYAEVRYAPEQHLAAGLSLTEVVEAVREGFAEGAQAAARAGRPIVVRQLLTAMRHQARSMEIAELAVRWRDRGVAGFDIAGAEDGFPPTRHLDAFEYLQRESAHFTIHAGEAFGLPSIWEAIQWCGADRLGHGVRIVDDISVDDDGTVHLGRLAAYVRDLLFGRPDVDDPLDAGSGDGANGGYNGTDGVPITAGRRRRRTPAPAADGVDVDATGAEGAGWWVALAALAGFASHLVWQLYQLDMDSDAVQLRLFRSNRDAGLILAVGLALAAILQAALQ